MLSRTTTSIRSRRHKRGAAMVEGIVVMGTMLVFFGMNLWAYKAYGGKIDMMSSTRRDALYFASQTCEKSNNSDPDSYTDSQLRGNASSGGQSSLSFRGLIEAIAGGGGNFDVFSTARSEKAPVDVTGRAITRNGAQGTTVTGLTARVGSKSAVGCNEKNYGDGILALLRLGRDVVMGIIGI
jgi:hypothetical protein